MAEPKQIVEEIRRERFGIGLDTENLPSDIKAALEDKKEILKEASKLAREIHTKNPHFIFELIQNAEDNEYDKNSIPTIKFIIDSDRLIIQNNECGLEKENVWKLCSIGGSTKTKALGYIGEKGIGFKSVFMVSDKVEICSNGFQFQFWHSKENPLWEKWEHATMILPEWINEVPDFIDSKQTNIVLYLKPEIRNEISKYIEEIHPSLLLFLKKLKVIEVEEEDGNKIKKIKLHEKDGIVEIVYEECETYWKVIKKLFKVPQDIDEERRRGVTETEIILAFPLKEDYSANTSEEQYVFAFLPIRKYGFKFIIQADFLLPITREDIIKDNKWSKWLRDSIIEVFLDAVSKFKNDEKLKYSFYDYLPVEEVKDAFFSPMVKQIYEKFKEEECILTEANRWKKPSEVLIDDEEIKKIITNDDLQKYLGKEYLSEKIKAKKQILNRLGVKDFSINDLIKCLENEEWIKNQNEEWFARLFNYLSKEKLSKEQLKRLKSLKIIKLENGELTSIREDIVFFPLEKKETYCFENELKVIGKDIIDSISKYEREKRDTILGFLKKLGLKKADPYEIIKKHILPVYENGKWKQKDSKVLMGYIRYIKDNIGKYEKESDKRLNANKSSWEPKEDSLKRLKESLLIRIDKDDEGKQWYDKPENIYLPKTYGNENDLEKLFEGIDVNFVHPCYIEQDIKHINDKITKLENKLSSKRWTEHKKEVEKIEGQIARLKNEKNKKVAEWKEFFLKIELCQTIIVKKDPKTKIDEGSRYADSRVTKKHIYAPEKQNTIWKNEEWRDSDWRGYYIENDWISPDLELLLNKLGTISNTKAVTISKQLLTLIYSHWDIYKDGLKIKYYYRYYGQQGWSWHFTKSTFYLILLKNAWLPTTQNTLAKPSEIFLDKPEIREVLGDTVLYLAVKIENEDFIKHLGINTQADLNGVLNYLKALVEQKNKDKEKFEKLYKFLDEHFEEDATKVKEVFRQNSLIFIPDADKNYYSSKEVIWKDVSNVFGKNRIYLEKYYPKFKRFFVEKLGISEKPAPKDYADVLCYISEKRKSDISEEDKKVIVRIYKELNRNLNPDKLENLISQEDWWSNFIKKPIFFTDKGKFWSNDGDIFINDNSELYELFKDEEDIGFLWLPDGYHPDKIRFFIKACNLHYLSESVEIEPLLEGATHSKDNKSTQVIQTTVPYVLRYLYWKENLEYEKLKKNGTLGKIRTIEVCVTDNLKVEYSIKLNEWRTINKKAEKKCIYHKDENHIYMKSDGGIYDLGVEFSKVFGEIKGLDDFIMNIMNDISNAESIMRAKNIVSLPESEEEILKKSSRIKKIKRVEKIEKGLEQPTGTEGEKKERRRKGRGRIETGKTVKISAGTGALTDEDQEDTLDKTKEKEWIPKFSAEKIPLRIEEYVPKQEVQKEIDKDESSTGKVHVTGTSKSGVILSEKAKKNIGREGEKYALYCILKKKLEHYFSFKIESDMTFEDLLGRYSHIISENDQGFRLQKDGDITVEIIWLNKNGESRQHYDIKIAEDGDEIFIEVKSTPEYGKAWFQVSKDQWRLMKEKEDKFYIYRVYGVGTENARIEYIRNPAKRWEDGYIDAYLIGIEI